MPDVLGLEPIEAGGVALTCETPVQFTELPESFLTQLCKRLPQEDIKSLRLVCPRLCALCNVTNKLTSLKASALLSAAAPTLACLPPITFLDFNARNAACSHQLLAALRQHGNRLEQSVRAVRLSGRDGLLAALQTLRLACPRVERLEIRCQHSYRGRHKECADLGRCLQELESAFPSLTELHLQRFPISSTQLIHLCDSLLGLRALSIRGLAHALTSESLAHLHGLTQLASLSVDHLKLQTGCLPCGSQLRSLELSDATISGPSFASLNALAGLQSLSVWGTGHRAALAFAPLTGLTALRRLHLELPLDGQVLEGLRGCTALANLSAPSARVLLQSGAVAAAAAEGSNEECYGAGGGDVGGGSVRGAAAAPPPPQLTSVTRLSLEAWSKDCLPLAMWLPGLRSLVLDDGAGMWNAVAGHEQLTALRAAAGGSLPSAEGLAAAPVASTGLEPGADACCPAALHCTRCQPHRHHHNQYQHRSSEGYQSGLRGSSDGGSRGHNGGCDGSSDGGSCGSSDGGGSDDAGIAPDLGNGYDGGDNRVDVGLDGGRTCVVCQSGRCNTLPPSPCVGKGEPQTQAAAIKFQPSGITQAANMPSCRTQKTGGAGAGGSACSGDGDISGGAFRRLPPQLASLRLGGCQDLPEQHYLSCASLPTLTACELSGCGALTTGALLGLLGAMPVLRELSLEGAPHMTDEALAELGAVGDGEVWRSRAGCGSTGNHGVVSLDGDGGGGVGMAAPLAVACGPAVAAALKAAVIATGVPVPPCNACAGFMGEGVAAPAVAIAAGGEALSGAATPQTFGAALISRAVIPRSSSAATLAAVVKGLGQASLAAVRPVEALGAASRSNAGGNRASSTSGAAVALRRLELTRLPGITARGIAAAAAGLPRLTELRISSCQAVCREACVWLPQQLGRPYLSVVCSHAAVYDDP